MLSKYARHPLMPAFLAIRIRRRFLCLICPIFSSIVLRPTARPPHGVHPGETDDSFLPRGPCVAARFSK